MSTIATLCGRFVLLATVLAVLGCYSDEKLYVDECRPGSKKSCGTSLGLCTLGVKVCVDGQWGACTGKSPAVEICDGQDNDCDGDVDEGFGVGKDCSLVGGCFGSRVCNVDGTTTKCTIDEARRSPELCDEIDNDCDGLIDYTLTPNGLKSACTCERRALAFGNSEDKSIENAVNLCALTGCNAGSMSFCLRCDQGSPLPYAMCESTLSVDLSSFDGALARNSFLQVDFTSSTMSLLPINLWYAPSSRAGGRKYLPLLKPGDGPGNYSKTFTASNACLPQDNGFSSPGMTCKGNLSGAQCACYGKDTCGQLGPGCTGTDYSVASLQVTAEFCPAGVQTFTGTIKITRVELISQGCL